MHVMPVSSDQPSDQPTDQPSDQSVEVIGVANQATNMSTTKVIILLLLAGCNRAGLRPQWEHLGSTHSSQ